MLEVTSNPSYSRSACKEHIKPSAPACEIRSAFESWVKCCSRPWGFEFLHAPACRHPPLRSPASQQSEASLACNAATEDQKIS